MGKLRPRDRTGLNGVRAGKQGRAERSTVGSTEKCKVGIGRHSMPGPYVQPLALSLVLNLAAHFQSSSGLAGLLTPQSHGKTGLVARG